MQASQRRKRQDLGRMSSSKQSRSTQDLVIFLPVRERLARFCDPEEWVQVSLLTQPAPLEAGPGDGQDLQRKLLRGMDVPVLYKKRELSKERHEQKD